MDSPLLLSSSSAQAGSTITGVQVSAWLSDRPWKPWGWDGLSFYRRHLIAYSLPDPSSTASTTTNISTNSDPYDIRRKKYMHRASQFNTTIKDGGYFKCPCALSMPPMKAAKTQADAHILLYVHISCSAIDHNGHHWHVGPDVSYPLALHV